jgi:transcriptional regulator with GAF, ATPase, and Fis domain
MESFHKVIGSSDESSITPDASFSRATLSGLTRLPTFSEAADVLVEEALARANGNQTIAARLLGITQSALSKRLKIARQSDSTTRV